MKTLLITATAKFALRTCLIATCVASLTCYPIAASPTPKPSASLTPPPGKRIWRPISLHGVNFNTLKVSDIVSGAYNKKPLKERFALLGKLKTRFPVSYDFPAGLRAIDKQGNAPNGLRYYMARDELQNLPEPHIGATTTHGEGQSNNALICKSTPTQMATAFLGPLFMGVEVNTNTMKVYPGALFRDDDIVRGIFTPVTPPRTPGSILIDVLNTTGSISQPVSNFNDKTIVFTAINDLRTATANAAALVNHASFAFEVKAADEVALTLESSTNVDLTQLLGFPVSIGQTIGGGVSMGTEFNMAVATIENVYYTISLGGEGPKSTISGSIPANTVCVTDVMYGSIAYLVVANAKTRLEATLAAESLLKVAEGLSAERNLSAEARRLLEGNFVKLKVVGGVVATSTSTITSIAQLREEMAKMDSTVAGVNAAPLYYNLCYASDNASVAIGAFADFTDTRCFKADKLDVTVLQVKPTNVVDFGDEELYGTIRVDCSGDPIAGRVFWTRDNSSYVAGIYNQNIAMDNQMITFNLNPVLFDFDEEIITMGINIKDKIMGGLDPEWAGASDTAKGTGYVQYRPTSFTVALREVRDAPNQTLEKTYSVAESGAAVEVKVRFKVYF
jgi:hypothetical protein